MGEIVSMMAAESEIRLSKATKYWASQRGFYENEDWVMLFYGYCICLCRDDMAEAQHLSAAVAENMQEPRLSVSPGLSVTTSARDEDLTEIYIEIEDPDLLK